jgi:hypothetical protein
VKKIFWAQEERQAIEDRMVELLRANPLLRKQELLRQAQQVLPMERRRKIQPTVLSRFGEAIDRARLAAKEPTAPPPPPVTEPEPQPFALGSVLDQILDLLADKIAERINQRAAAVADPVAVLRPKHNPQPFSEPRESRPGVLVVGLLNQQAQTIIQQFPQLEITCLTSEEACKRDALRRSFTILMTKFISHSVQDKYRKAENLTLCNGGVSELASLLKRMA